MNYGTAGAAVHVVDVEGRAYRESTLQDLFDAAQITDTLDNIHFMQRPMFCRDTPDIKEMDLNAVYACSAGTTKHVRTSLTEPSFATDALEMLHLITRGKDA